MNPRVSFLARKCRGQGFLFIFIFLVAGVILITGCERQGPSSQFPKQTVKKYEVATTLEGAVTDDRGPLKAGTVKVIGNNGQVIASTQLNDSEHYRIQIPAQTVLPIVLSFEPGGQKKGGEAFIAAVVHPNLTRYDINPLSTAIAKKAQALGGYTHANLVVAAESMGTVPDDNKMTAGFRGDPTKQYGGWH